MKIDVRGGDAQVGAMQKASLNMSEIGERLRLARLALGFETKAEFADVLRCNHGNWGLYESGKRLVPPRFVADMYARFGVTFDYVYAGREKDLPEDVRGRIHQLEREAG